MGLAGGHHGAVGGLDLGGEVVCRPAALDGVDIDQIQLKGLLTGTLGDGEGACAKEIFAAPHSVPCLIGIDAGSRQKLIYVVVAAGVCGDGYGLARSILQGQGHAGTPALGGGDLHLAHPLRNVDRHGSHGAGDTGGLVARHGVGDHHTVPETARCLGGGGVAALGGVGDVLEAVGGGGGAHLPLIAQGAAAGGLHRQSIGLIAAGVGDSRRGQIRRQNGGRGGGRVVLFHELQQIGIAAIGPAAGRFDIGQVLCLVTACAGLDGIGGRGAYRGGVPILEAGHPLGKIRLTDIAAAGGGVYIDRPVELDRLGAGGNINLVKGDILKGCGILHIPREFVLQRIAAAHQSDLLGLCIGGGPGRDRQDAHQHQQGQHQRKELLSVRRALCLHFVSPFLKYVVVSVGIGGPACRPQPSPPLRWDFLVCRTPPVAGGGFC